MKREVHGGVLVVGSLLWERDANRDRWREGWLSPGRARRVSAPIRYGRMSKGRGCTYTMVFSRLCLRKSYAGGIAIAVPFNRPTPDAESLLSAAHALWGAEDKSQNPKKRLGKRWGVVGLLMNPSRPSDELLEGWSQAVGGQEAYEYEAPTYTTSEGPVLDKKSGRLLLPWPRTLSGSPLDLDFLLATVTDPELVPGQRYPSVARIAAAWIGDRNWEVKYFLENRRNGICTFQDHQIRNYLSQAGIESV